MPIIFFIRWVLQEGRGGVKPSLDCMDMAIAWQHYGNKKVSAAIMLSLDFLLDNRA